MKTHRLFAVKEGKFEQWVNWCNELKTDYREEAQKTLAEENASLEECVLFQIEGKCYILGTNDFYGDPKKGDVSKDINKEHLRNRKECLEYITEGKILYSFKAPLNG